MGAAFGFHRSGELKSRERLLREILSLLESMATQIRYRALPLGELFGAMKSDGEFITAVHEKAAYQNWRGAWVAAAQSFPELTDGDKEVLCSIGNALGGSDTAGQVAMLELNKELLSARLKDAAQNYSKKGVMYRSVGILSGLGLGIVVL
jgi:stage III sporulation protein AB